MLKDTFQSCVCISSGTTLCADIVNGQDIKYPRSWPKIEEILSREGSIIGEDVTWHTQVSSDHTITTSCDNSFQDFEVNRQVTSTKEEERYAKTSARMKKIDMRLQSMLSQSENGAQLTERKHRRKGWGNLPFSACWSDSGYDGSVICKSRSEENLHQDSVARKMSYKYKNDIKSRFKADTDEKNSCQTAECEEDRLYIYSKEEESPPTPKPKDDGSQNDGVKSDSTSYPSSDLSTNGNTSSGSNGNGSSGGEGSMGPSNSPTESMGAASTASGALPAWDPANSVPGFVLHPTGTYYIPVVSPVSQLMPYRQNYGTGGICHPISIPVNFGGPLVCLQNICVSPQSTSNSGYKFTRSGHSHSQN